MWVVLVDMRSRGLMDDPAAENGRRIQARQTMRTILLSLIYDLRPLTRLNLAAKGNR